MKKERSFRVFVIYALLLQFAILTSQQNRITHSQSVAIENYNSRDATVQVLISYTDTKSQQSEFMAYTGTGTIIAEQDDHVYVLTARHVCVPNDPAMTFTLGIEQIVEIQDVDQGFHDAEIILLSQKDDLCIVRYSPGSPGTRNVAPVADSSAVIDSNVYMYAAPAGFYVPSAITQFTGVFSGESIMYGEEVAVYTIPAAGGASGASIVNKQGEIVGVLHSTLREFHHISLATTHSSTVSFIQQLEIQENIIVLD